MTSNNRPLSFSAKSSAKEELVESDPLSDADVYDFTGLDASSKASDDDDDTSNGNGVSFPKQGELLIAAEAVPIQKLKMLIEVATAYKINIGT